MKKLIVLFLLVIFALSLSSCYNISDNKTTVTGIIKEIDNDYILIATSTAEGHPYGASFDISVSIKGCDEIYKPLTVGDEVIIFYNGDISESTPPQIYTVYAITLKTPANPV